MVPFSFPQPLLKSRVMKERSLPSPPLARAKPAHPNGSSVTVARPGLKVNQASEASQIRKNQGKSNLFFYQNKNAKKSILALVFRMWSDWCLPACHNPKWGTAREDTRPTDFNGYRNSRYGVYSKSVSIGAHPWFKKPVRFQAI
jgi:hypothetical protein